MKVKNKIWQFPLLLLILVSCSLDDDRDACNQVNRVLFRYDYKGTECFSEYIHTVRYFLFDGNDQFVSELTPLADNPSKLSIDQLDEGSYTIVCIGNLADYATLEGYAEGGLSCFRLRVNHYFNSQQTAFANGDRLYWGQCHFTKASGTGNDFTGYVSNVHCALRIRVEWEASPAYSDGYRYRLDGIGTAIKLHGDNASEIDAHTFPQVTNYGGSMLAAVTLDQSALDATLYTLRFGATDIPRFRLCHYDTPVTTEIDLAGLFRQWGWLPGQVSVQDYSLRIKIFADGTVVAYQGNDVDVGDWENGGNIG